MAFSAGVSWARHDVATVLQFRQDHHRNLLPSPLTASFMADQVAQVAGFQTFLSLLSGRFFRTARSRQGRADRRGEANP